MRELLCATNNGIIFLLFNGKMSSLFGQQYKIRFFRDFSASPTKKKNLTHVKNLKQHVNFFSRSSLLVSLFHSFILLYSSSVNIFFHIWLGIARLFILIGCSVTRSACWTHSNKTNKKPRISSKSKEIHTALVRTR